MIEDRACQRHGFTMCAECGNVAEKLRAALYRDEDHPSLQGEWPSDPRAFIGAPGFPAGGFVREPPMRLPSGWSGYSEQPRPRAETLCQQVARLIAARGCTGCTCVTRVDNHRVVEISCHDDAVFGYQIVEGPASIEEQIDAFVACYKRTQPAQVKRGQLFIGIDTGFGSDESVVSGFCSKHNLHYSSRDICVGCLVKDEDGGGTAQQEPLTESRKQLRHLAALYGCPVHPWDTDAEVRKRVERAILSCGRFTS